MDYGWTIPNKCIINLIIRNGSIIPYSILNYKSIIYIIIVIMVGGHRAFNEQLYYG